MAAEYESEMEEVVVQPLTQFDPRRIDPTLGITAAIVIALPVAVAVYSGFANAGVMAALGAFNLFLGAGGFPTRDRRRATWLALVFNAVGLATGTLVATLGSWLLVAVAIGIGTLSLLRLIPGSRWVAATSAVLFAVGVGVPGASFAAASDRFLLALLGGAWAIAASACVVWSLARGSSGRDRVSDEPTETPLPRMWTIGIAAVAAGVAAAVALAAANALGLPRDYWTMVTVVVVFQTGVTAAISSSAVRVVGTIVGAAIGGLVATLVSGSVALTAIIGALAGGTLAVRPASPSIYVVLLTPFVIVLLSITYPSGWALAEDRVIDTLVGAGCALAATVVLWASTREWRVVAGPRPG